MTDNGTRKTAERRRAIVEAARNGEVSTKALSRRFGVTPSTIRRDLKHLAGAGNVARTYGGITLAPSPLEVDASRKALRQRREKEAIARRAAGYVRPGDLVILDAGTTTAALAAELRHFEPLTVVTGGMNALLELHDADAIELIVLGGRLRHVNQGTVGPLSELCLAHVTADRVFLGAEAIDPELGISCPTLEQAALKTQMVASAREVYVLADSSKLGRRPFHYWARLPPRAQLITDRVPAEFRQRCEELGRLRIEEVGDPGGSAYEHVS